MNLNIGDKVSFLNEKREGVVTQIRNDGTVLVAIEDGFEIPVIPEELIRRSGKKNIPEETKSRATNLQEKEILDVPEETEVPEEISFPKKTDITVKGGIYFCFVTGECLDIIDDYAVYLLNTSEKELLFSVSLLSKSVYIDRYAGIANPHSMVLLDFFDKDGLSEWERGRLRAIVVNNFEEMYTDIIDVKMQDGVLEHFDDNIVKLPVMDLKARLLPAVFLKNQPSHPPSNDNTGKAAKVSGLKIVGHIDDLHKSKALQVLQKHTVASGIAEVDLHIDELVDNLEGFTHHQLFMKQINYFRKCLDAAFDAKYSRIIFIHGKGNGKLRDAIRKEILERFPAIEIFDASMAKYGTGATELKIPRNMKL